MRQFAVHVCCGLALGLSLTARAFPAPFLIPAADSPPGIAPSLSFVYDNTRQIVLIAQPNGGVLRFDMVTRTFLPAWNVPGELWGIDITRDGSKVAVADGLTTPGAGNTYIGRLHVIDSATGVNTPITWSTSYNFGGGVGARDVIISNDNRAFVTPNWIHVSGREKLREIDLASGTVIFPPGAASLTVRDGSSLRRNPSGSYFFFTQGDTSSPQCAIYSIAQNGPTAISGDLVYGGVSPDGQRVAAYSLQSTPRTGVLTDQLLHPFATLPNGTSFVYTFDRDRPLIYFANDNPGVVGILSALDGRLLRVIHTTFSFEGTAHFEVSNDHLWAFVRTVGGVVAVPLPPPCPADMNQDTLVDFFDYLDFIDAFSQGDPSANFNHDQFIDFFDYLDYVDAFSAGC